MPYRVNFGRAPVRTVYPDALECLLQNKENFSNFVSHRFALKDAPQGFTLFEKYLARKVVFDLRL